MRFLAIVSLLLPLRLLAQQADPLLFKEKVHDFGEINEEGGHADFEFNFTNNSGRTIRIISVQASCGCTTPGWARDPIPQGHSGFVKASFDPKGRPGYFNKSLTVTTDLEGGPMVLQIKGMVVSKGRVIAAADYPVEKGGLRFRSGSFNLEKIFINAAPVAKEFAVYNATDKPIHFAGKMIGPAYIKVESPPVLGPHEKGTIRILYDARLRGKYGFASDNVQLGTDDDNQPLKTFSIYATVEESFPTLSPAELMKAPALHLEGTEFDLGRTHTGNVLEKEISLDNPGKKELIIHAVQENCSCLHATIEPMKIKAGEGGKVKISLDTQGRNGMQQKAVTIYSNDPRSPVQRITLTAYVEN